MSSVPRCFFSNLLFETLVLRAWEEEEVSLCTRAAQQGGKGRSAARCVSIGEGTRTVEPEEGGLVADTRYAGHRSEDALEDRELAHHHVQGPAHCVLPNSRVHGFERRIFETMPAARAFRLLPRSQCTR